MPDDHHSHGHHGHGHHHDHTPAPGGDANPVLVAVSRGGTVESTHRGRAIAVDSEGAVVVQFGDVEAPVFPRSAVKPLQAIPFVESGAAGSESDEEVALACASHRGEAEHVERVAAWLERVGLGAADLECGTHWPARAEAAHALAATGAAPCALHNNCSGKHAGMLGTARHRGEPTEGYVRPEHPVQQRVMGVLEQLCGVDLGKAPRGIDGCSIPAFALPLANLAFGFARFADPATLPPQRAAAIRRIHKAMTDHPWLVDGSERFATELMRHGKAAVSVKPGAEGVMCAAIPAHGIGIAVKCDDGAGRAAEVLMAGMLHLLSPLDAALGEIAAPFLTPAVRSVRGAVVGEVAPAGALAEAIAQNR